MIRSVAYYLTIFIFILSVLSTRAQDNALTLSDALQRALDNNYGIIISESETDIASLNNSWGVAGRYPTVGFDASSSNSRNISDNTTNNRLGGTIGLNWTVFDGYRVNTTKDMLDNLEVLAKGRSAVVVENTIHDVILGYYNVLLQMEQLEVLKNVTGLSADRYKYEMIRREIGSSVTYNVLQAKNVYLEDSAAYLNQQVVLRNAVRDLNFVLGEEPKATWTFTQPFEPDTTTYDFGDLYQKMMSGNQTLQNQYLNLMISKNEIRLRKGNLYPSLRLSTGVENSWSRSAGDGSDPSTGESVMPYANLSLSYDIYSGGIRKRAVEVARIQDEIETTRKEEIEHSLTNLLYNEYDLYNVRITLFNVAVENLEAAELNLEIAEEKFRNGAINSFNYRDIQLIYLNAALQKLRSVYNLINSQTSLTRMIGGYINFTP